MIVEATGLTKTYGTNKVLDDITLGVREGTVFALLGPNGAGKTTTIRILTTLTDRRGHGDGGGPRRRARPERRACGHQPDRPVLGGGRPADGPREPHHDRQAHAPRPGGEDQAP